jgi:hypothetical protein
LSDLGFTVARIAGFVHFGWVFWAHFRMGFDTYISSLFAAARAPLEYDELGKKEEASELHLKSS